MSAKCVRVFYKAASLTGKNIGAVVLECTNLISYRVDIQKLLNIAVFDLVSMIEF